MEIWLARPVQRWCCEMSAGAVWWGKTRLWGGPGRDFLRMIGCSRARTGGETTKKGVPDRGRQMRAAENEMVIE
jgi:hypothetical protein